VFFLLLLFVVSDVQAVDLKVLLLLLVHVVVLVLLVLPPGYDVAVALVVARVVAVLLAHVGLSVRPVVYVVLV